MIEYNVNQIESIEPTNKGFLINGEIAVGKAMSFGVHTDYPQVLLHVVEFHDPEFVEDPYSDEREETIGISSFNEEAHRLQQMLYKMGEW
jgi:hypothetical protein